MCNSKVTIFFFFTLLSSINCVSQIQWNSDETINWNNFKGIPPNGRLEFKANTFSIIDCEYGSYDTCFFYTVRAEFDELKSWHIDTSKELLEHERGHFNISEIYARMIRKFLKTNLPKGVTDNKIRMGVDSLQKLRYNYQALYDKETNYSKNLLKQKCWQLRIKKLLKELEEYRMVEYNNCPKD